MQHMGIIGEVQGLIGRYVNLTPLCLALRTCYFSKMTRTISKGYLMKNLCLFIIAILLSACTSTMKKSVENDIIPTNKDLLAINTNKIYDTTNDSILEKYNHDKLQKYNKSTKIDANMLYSYPKSYVSIIDIFKKINLIKKDEFTSSDQYNNNLINTFKELNILNNPFILKNAKTRDLSSPSLVYDADTRTSKIEFSINHIFSSRYSSKEKKFFGYEEKYVEVINIDAKLKEVEETGYNIFGVSNTYTRIRGDEYSVFFTNFHDVSDFKSLSINTNRIKIEDAKSLKSNIEIFFVVKVPDIYTSFADNVIFNELNTETPNIDSIFVYNTMQHVIKLDLIAILICDKKRKKVIDIVTNFN